MTTVNLPAKNYDLTRTISQYLDRHLVAPLLEHFQTIELYSKDEILKAKIDLISNTCMLDFATDLYKELHNTDTVPAELKQRRDKVVADLQRYKREMSEILKVIDNDELVKQLRAEKLFNLSYLAENFQITPEMVDSLYHYARFQFDCGNYLGAAECLYNFRALSNNGEKNLNALWGKLAAEILMHNWTIALEDLEKLRDAIDQKTFSSASQQLQQRTWLLHWALFVFFERGGESDAPTINGKNLLIDFFFQEKWLNTIQTTCPHLLRYLAAALIVNKRRKHMLKDLVRVIETEKYHYSDPITEFLLCLYSNFDFDGAQQKLLQCKEVIAQDYFLAPLLDEFVDCARLLIFETYCRIHQCIDIKMLAEKLNMTPEDAERWIVNLIRHALLDAKIDSEKNYVIMGTSHPSVYQQIIEKTKVLAFRSSMLASNIEKRQQMLAAAASSRDD
eukprot:GILI01001566.1.p1 GENE.GILI01001566.1~~GILI01001566.1.p1  ORF type:complete len:448 (+),score=176.44 GILI01001566.1:89-1432(+)